MEQDTTYNSKHVLKKLHALFRRTGERIVIGDSRSQQIRLVDPASIMYIKAEQNYTKWVLSDGTEFLLTCQLGTCEEFITRQICDEELTLARCGRSTIINFKYITDLDMTRKKVVISNRLNYNKDMGKIEISVPEEILKQLKEAIILYKETNENR